MPSHVQLSEKIIAEARISSKVFSRSLSAQIEHWAKIGKLVEENPDLTYEFMRDILISLKEMEAGRLEPYEFG